MNTYISSDFHAKICTILNHTQCYTKIALNNFVTWLRNRLSLHSHKTAYLRSTHAVLHFLLRCDKDSYDSSDCRTPYDTFYIDHRNKNNNFSF